MGWLSTKGLKKNCMLLGGCCYEDGGLYWENGFAAILWALEFPYSLIVVA